MSSKGKLAVALDVIARLQAEGHQAFLAGGCVRDLLLGRTPSDYDVATSALPAVVLDLFPRTFAVGAHFGVVLVASCEDESNCITEVATFRSDGVYSDGRHPDAVRYTLSAAEDVERRDFTINGLLLDPLAVCKATADPSTPWSAKNTANCAQDDSVLRENGSSAKRDDSAERSLDEGDEVDALADSPAHPLFAPEKIRATVIDYVGGLVDLDAGVVRAIGQPAARFEEDQLRMLRAVRFAARFGFSLDAATEAAIRALAPRIASVSRERVRDELTKMLTEGHARRAFELLDRTGLLTEVLPEVARMKGVEQPPQFHPEGDVFAHVLFLLEQLEAGCSLTLGWAALLHDVGKPATFRRAADRIRFDGHAEVGVAIAADICRRFRFSNEEARQIVALVENHMRFMDAQRMKDSTLKRFFRLDHFEEHLALHRMDCLAASGFLDNWQYMRERWQVLPAEVVRPRRLLTGRELIAAGYRPGPRFSAMLDAAEDAQLDGQIATLDEALALVCSRFGGSDNEQGKTGS
jgi:poly(A) polymerase